MAVNHDPILKRCRTLGISPAVLGYDKSSNRNPGNERGRKQAIGTIKKLFKFSWT